MSLVPTGLLYYLRSPRAQLRILSFPKGRFKRSLFTVGSKSWLCIIHTAVPLTHHADRPSQSWNELAPSELRLQNWPPPPRNPYSTHAAMSNSPSRADAGTGRGNSKVSHLDDISKKREWTTSVRGSAFKLGSETDASEPC